MGIQVLFHIAVVLHLIIGINALENLALDKTAEMSTQRSDDSGAEGAVDGDITQTANSGTCALTKVGKYKEAWWRVDLNGTFAITELKIYLLNTDLFRFRFYSVHVTDNLDNWKSTYCTRDHHSDKGPNVPIFTLNCDAKGRYVTIWLDRSVACVSNSVDNSCAILQLCEVQVLGCLPGNYSRSCNLTCPTNCREDLCSIDQGECYQCKDGYFGNTCQNECSAGLYGQDCRQTCNGFCADGESCSHINGQCLKGCMDGYGGEYCNESCKAGKHGPGCIYNCSVNCVDSNDCDQMTGSCNNGCKPGWTGNTCNKECAYGRYGLNCTESCGNCFNNTTCNNDNGYCVLGCTEGFEGIYCNVSCRPGTFGRECRHTCSSNCLNNDFCEGTTGVCLTGCDRGWGGPHCNESCVFGSYGYGCNQSCGHCREGTACHIHDGSCHSGCEIGWTGSICKTTCTFGTYGYNCEQRCNVNCKVGLSCNKTDGSCIRGCEAGWKGTHCNTTCDSGYYGEDCSDVCGRCYKGLMCDRQNGSCYNGCDPGFEGATCKEKCKRRYYGISCSLSCSRCEHDCDHVSGECLYIYTEDRIVMDGSATPWIVTSIFSTTTVIACVIIVIQCRGNYLKNCVRTNTSRQFPDVTRSEQHTVADTNPDMNYEELQIQSSESNKNVYESIQHERDEYTNTTLT